MASNDTPPTGVPTDAIAERYEAQSDRMGSQLPQKDLNSNSRRSRRHGVPKSALACTNCRLKKIKCILDSTTCTRCMRLELSCQFPTADERRTPYAKSHIRQLQNRISELESELEDQHILNARLATDQETPMSSSNNGLCNSDYFVMGAPWSTPPPTITIPSVADLQDLSLPSVMAEKPKTLLAMLCMPTSSLKLDDTGQLRYFGPTASLHTAQGSAAPFTEWAALATADHCPNNDLPEELQASLLDLYWKYQHPVLQIVHKEAFLMDMKSKSCRYYSKALLYAMLASAAKVSESLHIRNLALNKDSSASSSEPYLVKKTMILVDEELDENAGLTTIQALHLLSVAHCCRGNDQKGWMDAGRAIRLAFDLGLHKSLDEMDAHNHLKLDQEVRKTVLWGSFVFDRAWGMYLGRPHMIRMSDISTPSLLTDVDSPSLDLLMADAWVKIFTMLGEICDAIRSNLNKTIDLVHVWSDQLFAWRSLLHPSLQYPPSTNASVSMLHMQFCVAVILLYRPYAAFGTSVSELDASELARRDICVQHARILASIVGDYLKIHKSATTMASTGLYNIATAAVVLIADSADRGSLDQRSDHLYNIKVLVAALQDLEASYLVAETVLKQIGYLLKRSQLFRKTIAPCELTRTSWPANHTTPSIFSSVSL